MTWSQLLEDFAAAIADAGALAAATDGEGRDSEVPPSAADCTWTPPAVPPATAPTREELARFAELEARADACSERLEAAMVRVLRGLDETRLRRDAARRYGVFAAGSAEQDGSGRTAEAGPIGPDA